MTAVVEILDDHGGLRQRRETKITTPAATTQPHDNISMHPSTHDDDLDLWVCARTPEAASSLAQLLQDGVPPDDRNDYGETALHVAASRGNDEAVNLLLRYGAGLLVADWESGWTPLHRSLYHQHLSSKCIRAIDRHESWPL